MKSGVVRDLPSTPLAAVMSSMKNSRICVCWKGIGPVNDLVFGPGYDGDVGSAEDLFWMVQFPIFPRGSTCISRRDSLANVAQVADSTQRLVTFGWSCGLSHTSNAC